MFEPKLISPLLDNFAIGSSISEHDGVYCYPAMREDSDEKYILKVTGHLECAVSYAQPV